MLVRELIFLWLKSGFVVGRTFDVRSLLNKLHEQPNDSSSPLYAGVRTTSGSGHWAYQKREGRLGAF